MMEKSIVILDKSSIISSMKLTCQMDLLCIIWLLLGGTDQQTQQIFSIILVLMIPKKQKHAMLNYGKQIFFLKVGIVLFQYTTFFADLCPLNIKFLLTATQLNI